METTESDPASADKRDLPRFTVLGLFEDSIDAEQALVALRREEQPAEQVSVLVRDRAADAGGGPERHGEVARAVMANALSAVSGWLLGLAALIVPENGTYLVAGPIGAALAGVRTVGEQAMRRDGEGGEERPEVKGVSTVSVRQTLAEFGFRLDEASYLQSRVSAGSVLVAITTSDPDDLHTTRRLFADSSAVYIGQAQTGEMIVQEVEELLAAPPEESAAGDVVIADAVAPLRRLCGGAQDIPEPASCGRSVVDTFGDEVGQIEYLLADGSLPVSRPPIVRYVVIGFGGLLGLGRHRIAVPAEQIELHHDPARLTLSKEILRRAPAFDPDIPFSRREEMAVNAYFGTTPYWLR